MVYYHLLEDLQLRYPSQTCQKAMRHQQRIPEYDLTFQLSVNTRHIGSHSPRMARDRVSTDNRPESRDRGLRLQTDWDPNLAPRPRFWSDLPIGAEPGFNTGSGTPLCDFGTAEVGRWWFISILIYSILVYPLIPPGPLV